MAPYEAGWQKSWLAEPTMISTPTLRVLLRFNIIKCDRNRHFWRLQVLFAELFAGPIGFPQATGLLIKGLFLQRASIVNAR